MQLFAIPLHENGTEKLGTLGVRSGKYKSVNSFIRYNLSISRDDGYSRYNIYNKVNSDWRFLKKYTRD